MNTSPRQNTYQYYQEVHKKMQSLYNNSSKDEKQAKELQSFLHTIKFLGRHEQPGKGLVNQAALQIWQEAQKMSGLTTNSILNRAGGQNLEDDLTNIILATVPNKIREQIRKNINIGNKHVNIGAKYNNTIDNIELLQDEDIVYIMRDIRPDLKTYEKTNQNNIIKIRSTQGKIDVTGPGTIGMELSFEFDSPELKKYYNLLSNATFTAKNYASESTSYNKHFGTFQRDLDADFPNLHLGNSDPYKAIFSSLQFLGYPSVIIKSAFFAAYWSLRYKNEFSDDIGTHIWHLRFAYELTGRGSFYSDINFSLLNNIGAKFLIYNDPASDFISVVSTNKLVKDILLNSEIKDNPFGEGITISKRHIRNMSRSY